jgi:hypothetical protein
MTDAAPACTQTSKVIKAAREALYRAFPDIELFPTEQPWLSGFRRGDDGKIDSFDARAGGRYRAAVLSFICTYRFPLAIAPGRYGLGRYGLG